MSSIDDLDNIEEEYNTDPDLEFDREILGNTLDGEFYETKDLPNSTAVLVLGILSIITSFLYIIPGLICGIIALSLHAQNKRIYKTAQRKYQNSYNSAQAGFVCAIIGLSLSSLFTLFYILGAVLLRV